MNQKWLVLVVSSAISLLLDIYENFDACHQMICLGSCRSYEFGNGKLIMDVNIVNVCYVPY